MGGDAERGPDLCPDGVLVSGAGDLAGAALLEHLGGEFGDPVERVCW